MVPVLIPRVYLSPEQLSQLQFKPTAGTIQLSEGNKIRFNCSIDIPDARLEPIIIWVKNGQDLAENIQVVINELQTTTDGVTTLLSTVRYVAHTAKFCSSGLFGWLTRVHVSCSISQVQRADAGEYSCRLSISTRMVESQPIILEVQGEFQSVSYIRCLFVCPCLCHRPLAGPFPGLPTFIHQPEDKNVTRNAPFTLTCEAAGPPDPVQIRWLRNGLADTDFLNSSSTYYVSGEAMFLTRTHVYTWIWGNLLMCW